MITIPVIEKCPHTETAQGVMRVSHNVLATLAGAIYDKDEWIALLVGTRSVNGLDITVTDLRIPLQERSHASCKLAKPEPLASDVVGVVHSHHSMGAFFSKTDDDTLNPRFPSSLVVAHVKAKSDDAERLLGFSYEAEGRAALPCGSQGIIGFTVVPMPLIPEWPELVSPGFSEPDTQITLYHCPHITKTSVNLMDTCTTACSIEYTEPSKAIFGRNGQAFLVEVQEKTQRTKWIPRQHGLIQGIPINDKRYPKVGEYYDPWEGHDEAGYLKHWGV